MMHRNMVGHCYKTTTSAFLNEDDDNMYSFAAPASVDCTLSLATPSTRRFNDNEKRAERRMSNFCWDILPPPPSIQPPPSAHKSAAASDGIVPRRCANCDTTSTPLWRNGPRGPKSLCNACGIRFKKEERRASAAAAATVTCAAAGGVGIETQHHVINTSWVHHHHHHAQTQKMGYYTSAYGNEFRLIDDDHRDSDAGGGIPFISWRLSNVADRSSLVHDFTR